MDENKQESRLEEEDEQGTLIRGADGELYFIPNEDMQEFQLEGSNGEWARNIFEVSEEEVEETSEKVRDIYEWSNMQLRLETALQGVTPSALADDEPTKVG
jgi:hypothetical protein